MTIKNERKMKKISLNKLIQKYRILVQKLVSIVENAETDAVALMRLSQINDPEIQGSISLNPNTPSKVLENWLSVHNGIGGTDTEWRIHIVYNPSLRLDVLKQIIKKDKSKEVKEAALAALALRISRNSKATSEELLRVYKLIGKNINNRKRKKAAMEALKKHPKFSIKA